MPVTLDIESLTTAEKLETMEALWESLSKTPEEVLAPAWHLDELRKTQERADQGLEEPVAWKIAKARLAKRFSER